MNAIKATHPPEETLAAAAGRPCGCALCSLGLLLCVRECSGSAVWCIGGRWRIGFSRTCDCLRDASSSLRAPGSVHPYRHLMLHAALPQAQVRSNVSKPKHSKWLFFFKQLVFKKHLMCEISLACLASCRKSLHGQGSFPTAFDEQ